MESRLDILNELKTLSPVLAEIGNANVFSVPEGYFDSLSGTVLACLQDHAGVATISSADVPTDYFNNLADSILAKIKLQEADEELSPVLQNLRNVNVFKVPAGYFENVSAQILDKAITKQPAKVISFGSRFVKYAAAAMLTGAITLGVYKFTDNSNQSGIVTPPAFAKLDETIEKGKNMDDKQFNETLENLSPDDIANYLEQNGDEKDIELLASNIEENNLPTQDDYFLDEKTLENYLQELDTKQTDN